MFWLVFLTLVHAGPRKKERPKGRLSAPVEASAPPQAPTGRPVASDRLPALEGQDASLSLEGLTRSAIRFTFEMDLSVLGLLRMAEREALIRHLSADPGWRVSEREGVLLAERRQDTESGPTVGLGGYHLGDDACWRVGVRLSQAPDDWAWSQSPPVAQLTHETTLVDLWAYVLGRDPCRGQQALALTATGPAIALEILDSGDGSDMPHILDTLGPGILFLHAQSVSPTRVTASGYEARALTLPLSEPQPPSLAPVNDEVDFRAWVNPGEPGTSWLRLMADGAPLFEARVANSSAERPGWSDSPDQRFPLQSRLDLPAGPARDLDGQLWFQPDEGPARQLWQGPLRLPERRDE